MQPVGDASGETGPVDANLAGWLEACPVALDDQTKAVILAMVKAAGIAST